MSGCRGWSGTSSGLRCIERGSFSQLEPLLLAEGVSTDSSPWDASARSAAALLEAPRALLLLEATAGLHHVAGQVGLGPELTTLGALAFESSPARVVMARQSSVVLGPAEASNWGLGGWVETTGSRWTLAAPVALAGRPVGALVVVAERSAAERSGALAELTQLARRVSERLEDEIGELRAERSGSLTQLEPGAARSVVQAAAHTLCERAARLHQWAEPLWPALTALDGGALMVRGPAAAGWLQETWQQIEPLRRRLEALEQHDPAAFAAASAELLNLALTLFELRPALALARRLGTRQLDRRQAREAWGLLGSPERPPAVAEASERLAASLRATPAGERAVG